MFCVQLLHYMAMATRTRGRIPRGTKVPNRPPDTRKRTTDGYMELFWRTGPNTYLTALEHRVIDGTVTTEEVVHHRNGNRLDNRPSNLEPMTSIEHGRLHHQKVPWDRAVEMYLRGVTTTEIADTLGSWPGNVSRALRDRDVVMRKGAGNKVYGIQNQVIALHNEGLRPREIASRLGLSDSPIRRILKENGIEPYTPGRPFGSKNKAPRRSIRD